jgi:hypothetical protein
MPKTGIPPAQNKAAFYGVAVSSLFSPEII